MKGIIMIVLMVFISGCATLQNDITCPSGEFMRSIETVEGGFIVVCSPVNGNVTVDHLDANSFTLLVPVDEDLRFPVNALKVGATFPPEETPYTLNFASNRNEYAYVVAQMSHTRASGTNISGHIHWQSDTNALGDVVWAISYSCASINGDFPAFQTLSVVDSSVGNSATHLMSPPMVIPAEDLGLSGICKIEIYRDTTDIRDTYLGDANMLEFDLHYKVESLGETFMGYSS